MRLYNADSGGTRPSSFNNPGEEYNENGLQAGENGRPELAMVGPEVELRQVLNPDHQRMLLLESGIFQDVTKARGYRSVETRADLRRLGFSDIQCNVPGLLVPIHSPSGGVSSYQFRADQPRIKDGKPIKYETPKGSRMVLDVHPFAREKLGDPSVPLFVTEGVKKGNALVSHGLCAIALLGVWNWRGTNEHGGKTVLPEWEHVALNGRQVYIAFDSDIMLKPQVYAALARLKAFLEAK